MPSTTTQVALSSFGNDSPLFQMLGVATIQIQTLNGDLIPISVLIVPKIATPIQNSCRVEMENMPHLKGLKLANPITDNDEFLVSILIEADYYWSFVQDHIIRGNNPTAQQSQLGYLLSGPLPLSTAQLSTSILMQIITTADNKEVDLQLLWSIEAVGTDSHEPSPDFSHPTSLATSLGYQMVPIQLNFHGRMTHHIYHRITTHVKEGLNICSQG